MEGYCWRGMTGEFREQRLARVFLLCLSFSRNLVSSMERNTVRPNPRYDCVVRLICKYICRLSDSPLSPALSSDISISSTAADAVSVAEYNRGPSEGVNNSAAAAFALAEIVSVVAGFISLPRSDVEVEFDAAATTSKGLWRGEMRERGAAKCE